MRSAKTENASQDKQQNQKIITTNNIYIQNLMSILEKLNNNVKIASDKTETQQKNSNFHTTYMGPDHNEVW